MSSPFTLTQQVLARVQPDESVFLQRCMGDPTEAPDVRGYLTTLRARVAREEFLDLETAERVADACEQAFDLAATLGTDEARDLAQAAASYFVMARDAEADDSVIGFDDDLRVAEAVVAVLREEAGS